MKDKDQILLENIYELIYEEKAIMANSHKLIGEKVEVHPAIQGTPEKQPLYMAWSIKLNNIVVHNTKTLLLKNCTSTIKHDTSPLSPAFNPQSTEVSFIKSNNS
jgi:hypothetical protein